MIVKVQKMKTMKYFRIYFDKNLKWRTQTRHIRSKENSISYLIYHYRNLLQILIKNIIYKTLCESVLRYGFTTYGSTSEVNLKPIKLNIKGLYNIILI